MLGNGIGISLWASTAALAGGPSPTAQPALTDLAAHFKADAIPAQTDNTALASWTDSVAGLTITPSTTPRRPLYRTSRLGGKPAVQFTGTQAFTIGSPAVLADALARASNTTGVTLFWVVANLSTTDDVAAAMFAREGNGGEYAIETAFRSTPAYGKDRKFSSARTGITVCVMRQVQSAAGINQTHYFANMNAVAGWDIAGRTGTWNLGGDPSSGSVNSFKGDMLEFGWYNRAITNAEIAQLTKWACEKYGQAYPWAGLSKFYVFDGDSITWGQSATATTGRGATDNAWPRLLTDAKSIPWSGWSNLGIPSQLSATMGANANLNYAGLAAQLGIPVRVIAMEYFNEHEANALHMKAYVDAVKAADPNIKIMVLDSTDNNTGGTYTSNRAAFNAAINAYAPIDVHCPLSTDAFVGAAGTATNATYFDTDTIHPLNAGYAKIADFVGQPSYFDALAAM